MSEEIEAAEKAAQKIVNQKIVFLICYFFIKTKKIQKNFEYVEKFV